MKNLIMISFLVLCGCNSVGDVDTSTPETEVPSVVTPDSCIFTLMDYGPSYATRVTDGTLFQVDFGGGDTIDFAFFGVDGSTAYPGQMASYYRVWDNDTPVEWEVGMTKITEDCTLEIYDEYTSNLRWVISSAVLDVSGGILSADLYDADTLFDGSVNFSISPRNW